MLSEAHDADPARDDGPFGYDAADVDGHGHREVWDDYDLDVPGHHDEAPDGWDVTAADAGDDDFASGFYDRRPLLPDVGGLDLDDVPQASDSEL